MPLTDNCIPDQRHICLNTGLNDFAVIDCWAWKFKRYGTADTVGLCSDNNEKQNNGSIGLDSLL